MAEHVENQARAFVEVIFFGSVVKFYAWNTKQAALDFIMGGLKRKMMSPDSRGMYPPRATSLDLIEVSPDVVGDVVGGFVDYDAVVAMALMPPGWVPEPAKKKEPWEQ